MNRYLNNEAKRSASAQPQSPAAAMQAPASRKAWSWRTWTVLAALLFGLYVYAGHFVLRRELQWSTVYGELTGRQAAAAASESATAEADKAGKVSAQQEAAKVDPQVEIAARTAAIQIETARAMAHIEVQKQAKLNALTAIQDAASTSASAYVRCMDRAQMTSESAAAHGNTTFGAREVARQAAIARAQVACEPLMSQQERAQEQAAIARAWAAQDK